MRSDICATIKKYGNGMIYWGVVKPEDKEMLLQYYDMVHDIIVPWIDGENRSARINRVRAAIPVLSDDAASALISTVEFDYR